MNCTITSPRLTLLLALLLPFASACESELREGAFPDQEVAGSTSTSNATGGTTNTMDAGNTSDASTEADSGGTPIDVGGQLDIGGGGPSGGITDMNGTWIQVQELSTCVLIGNLTELRTRYLLKINIVQDGPRLTETYDVCRVSNTPLLSLVTTVPRAVVRASSKFTTTSHLLGTNDNQGYVSGVQTHLWGLQMDDPIVDPFPNIILRDEEGEILRDEDGNPQIDADHPNLVDSDEDGNPGATLFLGGDACEVYMIQRALTSISGSVLPDGTIEGTPFSRTEQLIMQASSPICAQSFDTFSNNAFSRMRMFRADSVGIDLDTDNNGEVSCEELVAAEEQLITWTEPDNARCERQ